MEVSPRGWKQTVSRSFFKHCTLRICKLAEECLPRSESADAATEAGAALGGCRGRNCNRKKNQNQKRNQKQN
jgi:hypothetical protein